MQIKSFVKTPKQKIIIFRSNDILLVVYSSIEVRKYLKLQSNSTLHFKKNYYFSLIFLDHTHARNVENRTKTQLVLNAIVLRTQEISPTPANYVTNLSLTQSF